MKIPQLLLAAIVLFATALCGTAQITRATFPVQTDGITGGTITNRLEVPNGEVWELLQVTGGISRIGIWVDGEQELYLRTSASDIAGWTGLSGMGVDFYGVPDTRKPLVVGPASLEIRTYTSIGQTNFQGSLVYRRITNQPASPPIPSNTVVIPTDATGPVQIILESSVDLINWTAAEPGTYGSSTEKRFFRLRAVVTPSP